MFDQCRHGNWWFLPWHRAYLLVFKRILHHMAKIPTLTLTYWDYSASGQGMPPEVFRAPTAEGRPNPLYLPEKVTLRDDLGECVFRIRDLAVNDGATFSELVSSTDVLRTLISRPHSFYNTKSLSNVSFGGVSSGTPRAFRGTSASWRTCRPTSNAAASGGLALRLGPDDLGVHGRRP